MSSAAPTRFHRPDIDGLRAVAITPVVLYHAGFPLFSGGYVGVDVFFVISGFLIGGIVYRSVEAGTFIYSDFYARRMRRIVPALATVMIVFLAVGIVIFTPTELDSFAVSAFAATFGLSNILFWMETDYFSAAAERNPMLMTWSLGVEEQFYFLLPILLLLTSRLPRRATLPILGATSLASFAISAWITGRDPSFAFYWLPTRAWELGVGVMLAIREERSGSMIVSPLLRSAAGITGASVIAVSVFAFDYSTPFPGAAAAVPVIGATLLIAARHGPVSWLLGRKPIALIGLVSYSWYLWHWPLMATMRTVANRNVPGHLADLTTMEALAAVVVSFILAFLSWHIIEKPFRRSATGRRTLCRRYAIVVAAVAVPTAAAARLDGLPGRYPGSDVARPIVDHTCFSGNGTSGLPAPRHCYGEGPGVAILGDSHANAIAPGIRTWAEAQGLSVTQFTKASCPSLLGYAPLFPERPFLSVECGRFNKLALAKVLQDSGISTVFVAGYWSAYVIDDGRAIVTTDGSDGLPGTSAARLHRGLVDLTRRLTSAGKRVVILGDVPIASFDVAAERAASAIPARRYAASLMTGRPMLGERVRSSFFSLDGSDDLILDAGQRGGGRVILLRRTLCAESGCQVMADGHLFYRDAQHLSAAGAHFVVRALESSN
ncbi:acyltransferase family protein [Sphingosinicella terrae]|uniref:acyltransferase family protein n=1 Tax=Sphingosinicella terrae TaxID=2172047 RepID=UPI000E0DDAB3|nr:acyltransferase family protein [Sphingosinicella terrae]